jgi:hypothetical protein
MKLTGQSNVLKRGVDFLEGKENMEERTYKIMGGSGALNLAFGVVIMVVGIAGGVLLVISGAKLLAGRNKILF